MGKSHLKICEKSRGRGNRGGSASKGRRLMPVSVGTDHTTTIAKSLKRALAERGFALGLMRCRETVAKMFGYVNFHELRAVSLRSDAPPRYEKDMVVSD